MPSIKKLLIRLQEIDAELFVEINESSALTEKHKKAAAKLEIKAHSLEMADFVEEVGSQEDYTGQQVLDWLGY